MKPDAEHQQDDCQMGDALEAFGRSHHFQRSRSQQRPGRGASASGAASLCGRAAAGALSARRMSMGRSVNLPAATREPQLKLDMLIQFLRPSSVGGFPAISALTAFADRFGIEKE